MCFDFLHVCLFDGFDQQLELSMVELKWARLFRTLSGRWTSQGQTISARP